MNFIRLLPVFFSFLLIAAHFQRAGLTGVGLACMVAPGLLFITRPWSVHIVQILLLLSAAEWVLTCIKLVNIRLEHGLDSACRNSLNCGHFHWVFCSGIPHTES